MKSLASNTYIYCEKFGFDHEYIQRRLALLGLGDGDLMLAKRLQERVIRPNVKRITGQFYRLLEQDEEFLLVVKDKDTLNRLKKTQVEYLTSLGVDFTGIAYFESRLRVGLAHVWANVGLAIYHCAYRILQQLLIDSIPPNSKKKDIYIAFIL
ncbi:MAG: protoglobin domain-containing protein, partial [Gammaproteobacteria bacterium]|nr:protoglobin domain-containing protein [Gammaproteobacteria bacterium]